MILIYAIIKKGEFQLKELIRAFKKFIGVMNSNSKNKAAKIITKPCFYPLNQFHKEFVLKAKKGVSDINWQEVIAEIQNEVDEEAEFIFDEDYK